MSRIIWFAVVVGVLLLGAVGQGVDGKARVGMNLAGPADWNTELPFVDVFRMSRPWISQRAGEGWGWNLRMACQPEQDGGRAAVPLRLSSRGVPDSTGPRI